MKTIAQQLNITKFPFEIDDKNDNLIYFQDSYDYWWKREYDKNGNEIYFENSSNFWWKSEYDENNNEIYHEDSDGVIYDNRTKQKINKL